MSFAVVSGDSIWNFTTKSQALNAFNAAVARSASTRLIAVCTKNGRVSYRDLTPRMVRGEYAAAL